MNVKTLDIYLINTRGAEVPGSNPAAEKFDDVLMHDGYDGLACNH